ncbi:hypothetical protein B0J17DRAFT_408177 [Rhizoctonia solani]|nr:hypothetical protein B0J17DRAFT_408177 [Rhizoctonia solani]
MFTVILSCRPTRFTFIMALVFSALAAISPTSVFIIDGLIITVAGNKVSGATEGSVEVMDGNVPRLILGAMIALWPSVAGILYSTFMGDNRRREAKKELPEP